MQQSKVPNRMARLTLLLFLLSTSPAAGNKRLRQDKLVTKMASSAPRVGTCLNSTNDQTALIRAFKQRYGADSFVVASAPDTPEPLGRAPMHAFLEALLEDCDEVKKAGVPWYIDVGAHDHRASALASSLGCSVAAFDPKPSDINGLKLTGCLNDPKNPFVVLPSLAAETNKVHTVVTAAAHNQLEASLIAQKLQPAIFKAELKPHKSKDIPGVTLDSIFMHKIDDTIAPSIRDELATVDPSALSSPEITLLSIIPERCCGTKAALHALQGASELIKSGRARCIAFEMILDPNVTEEILPITHDLELAGYHLFQAGPLDSPNIEVSQGSYPVYKTDSAQLKDLYETYLRIRRFDERSGYRVYEDGLSLDQDGRYFDYTNMVLACRGRLPRRLVVKEMARIRFQDGMWWPEVPRGYNSSKFLVREATFRMNHTAM